jgi:hypothetical protein
VRAVSAGGIGPASDAGRRPSRRWRVEPPTDLDAIVNGIVTIT